MRLKTLIGVLAMLAVMAAGAQTPQQYATGTCWEASLSSSPEISLLGAASIAATGGNIYILQGNTLRKLAPDLRELASIQLPDLLHAVAAVEDTRFEITCGMQGPDLGYVYGPEAPLTQYSDGWMNTSSTNGSVNTSGAQPLSIQQCVNQNMMQGLHQAHVLKTMSQVQLAADQYGVYLLRGGRLTVFDQDLREMRGKDLIQSVSSADQCPICMSVANNGMVMDQVRFRGMNSGLCPGPGQYQYGWNSTPSGTLIPASYPETPTSLGGATGVSAPVSGTGYGPGAYLDTGISGYGTATAGSPQYRAAASTALAPVPGSVATAGVTTTPGTIGTAKTGTTTGFGTSGGTPTGFGTALNQTVVTSGPMRGTTAVTGTGAGAYGAAGSSPNTGYTVVTSNHAYETETGFETTVQSPDLDPRTGQYGWMWDLPQLVPGAIYPLARRPITSGNVFLGVSGDQQRGPQALHLHVLGADGTPDPQGEIISAYLYQRGDVEAGRTLALQKHAPGEYKIRFDPADMRGDTLAVRASRQGRPAEVVYLPLSGPEPEAPR